jgi:arsenate reductase-like glutaredoxin family protein
MAKMVVYQKPTCTTCRQVYAALKESGVDLDAVDYYTDPIPKTKLKELLKKAGMKSPRSASHERGPLQEVAACGARSQRIGNHRPGL